MLNERSSGILVHPTSFPSIGGVGDLGPAAYEFVDWLAAGGQTLWQVLPLAPVGIGDSPYSATSAFAGNILLISLERLAERGLISQSLLQELPRECGAVNYQRVRETKIPLLREAALNFLKTATGENRQRFESFCSENGWWLENFVLFDALRERHNNESWNRWPREFSHRDPAAIERFQKENKQELDIARFLQFAFIEQWRALHAHCRRNGIRIIGDIAIFVSYDSADVWTHPDIFRLGEDLEPEVVAGVPPDAFSELGQRWGNPIYRWDELRQRGYDWWVNRMRWSLFTCDIIRLDHFRGFQQYWEIPASEPTAVRGRWVDGPQDDLFRVLRQQLGELAFIAEDLGLITPDVHALRERLDVPGMRVLQFAFGDPGAHIYLPHRYERKTVVYTGTHDNDTTLGWWKSISDNERRLVTAYLGEAKDGVNWSLIRAAINSTANLCVIQLQDVLGLGTEGRMNIPSVNGGNWAWRYQPGALTKESAEKLATMVEVADRLPSGVRQQGHGEAPENFAA